MKQNMELIDAISELHEVIATLRIIGRSVISTTGLDPDLLSDSIQGQANHLEKITKMIAELSDGEA